MDSVVVVVEGSPPRKKTMLSYFSKIESKSASRLSLPTDNKILSNSLNCGGNQSLAPRWNQKHIDEFQSCIETFDSLMRNQHDKNDTNGNGIVTQNCNYLDDIKSSTYIPFKVKNSKRDPTKIRKYFQFYEDVRPPYAGTWQKTSFEVTGRRPLGKDERLMDYDNDSEAEWDVGGPGESLKGDSDEEEEQDDYEIDMKTFVPHGYVSDDEIDCPSDPEDNDRPETSRKEENLTSDSVQIISDINMVGVINGKETNNQSTRKNDINPYVVGPTFADNVVVSEVKLEFLKEFKGVMCD